MRAKKHLTYVTLVCSLLSILAALIVGKSSNCICYDIAMAVFGSALLGFIMSLIEYHTERRSAMETFWFEAIQTLGKLRLIEPYIPKAPFEMILDCFTEEERNAAIRKQNVLGLQPEHTAKEALIEWYKSNENDSLSLSDESWDSIYTSRLNQEKENIKKLIDSCCDIASIDLSRLDSAYGNLDFAVHNKKIRNQLAYTQIYDAIRTYRNRARSDRDLLRSAQVEERNFPLGAREAYDIAEEIFEVQEKKDDKALWKQWFQNDFYKIDMALNQFWEAMYPGKKADAIENVPVCSVYISKPNDTEAEEVEEDDNAKS